MTSTPRIPGIAMMHTLSWTPFLQPMNLHETWLLLLPPLVIGIAIVYKALKTENLARLPAEAIRLTLYIHLFMIIIAAMLWLLVEGVERL